MKVVILAGGYGTRIYEESELIPKPMIEIGGMPIIWHIMKEYSYYGFNDFIICTGYKQYYIKKWFADYYLYGSDVCFNMTSDNRMEILHSHSAPWKVTVIDTGADTMTGGRIKRIQEYVGSDTFMMTYGDGVCDVDINALLKFHEEKGKLATLTSVIQLQTKGALDINYDHSVRAFREKGLKDSVSINAGYMVLEPKVFDYIDGDDTIFETNVLGRLANEGQLMSYTHNGFWQCMDTKMEKLQLEKMWKSGNAPWKIWNE